MFTLTLSAVTMGRGLVIEETNTLTSYALVGGAPEAYGSRRVCVCLCVCMSFARISLQWLKT